MTATVLPGGDAGPEGGVPAGAVDVGQGQQRGEQASSAVAVDAGDLDQGAVGQRHAHRFGLAAGGAEAGSFQNPPLTHEVCSPARQNSHTPQEIANGAITKSPGATVVTSGPTSSTTPMNSWPIGVVEEVRSDVTTLARGDFVIAPFLVGRRLPPGGPADLVP